MPVEFPAVAAGPTIHDHLRRNLDDSGRLTDLSLPDDAAVRARSRLPWAPGAQDGVFVHHASGSGGEDHAADLTALLIAASVEPSPRRLRDLYEHTAQVEVLDAIDDVIDRLKDAGANPGAIHALARWLVTTAADRGPVKVGIALLGATGLDDLLDVVRTLGAHDEFTLYAAVAVSNSLPDPERELWALAKAVDGWGRVHCVERLRDTTDPAIRGWILREGFRTSVMDQYLAHIAATTGGLLEALRAPRVDREVLTAAGAIFQALFDIGGPAQDISHYTDAADAIEAYLTHMTRQATSLTDLVALADIHSFLTDDHWWDDPHANGWTPDRHQACLDTATALIADPRWTRPVEDGLDSLDPAEFTLADRAARARGTDTFTQHLPWIERDPLDAWWYTAWLQADPTRAEQLITLAGHLLPLDDIGTGPADEPGLGQRWRAHNALQWTIQALQDHPGHGTDLLITALRSPVVGNRTGALSTVSTWPPDAWSDDLRAELATVATTDPSDTLRENATTLLATT
ncbi:hypothetical protein [Actinokineospora terrae]|uniref:Limonene hydroxylase n=1 Tax=Actinokineospora terrae TaxID=155974 RepID=A0A1H9MTT6_9PSEU|nr:hypothetical protein [Actinokineospora terrae]SER26889.1 hypothetical protein SAMN04487818_102322 [Actinokineospora terrae]